MAKSYIPLHDFTPTQLKKRKNKSHLEEIHALSAVIIMAATVLNVYLFWNPTASENFKITPDSRVFLEHDYGSLILNHTVSLKNIGDAPGYINKIDASLTDPAGVQRKLVLSNYRNQYKEPLPFVEIPFSESEALVTNLSFYEEEVPKNEQVIRELSEEIRTEVNNVADTIKEVSFKRLKLSARLCDKIDNTIKPLLQYSFKPGDYQYILSFTKFGSDKPFITFHYILSISQINYLDAIGSVEYLKRFNLLMTSSSAPGTEAKLRLINIEEFDN